LVFVRTKVRAERVLKALERVKLASQTIHGGKDQEDRFEVLNSFKNGLNNILIATDVSSRGIDIPNVDFVINYDLPEKVENYVHRVGRTGRASKKGQAISFCSKGERDILKEIEEYLDKPIAKLDITKGDYMQTIEFSNESHSDWRTLINQSDGFDIRKKKKKGGKKKR